MHGRGPLCGPVLCMAGDLSVGLSCAWPGTSLWGYPVQGWGSLCGAVLCMAAGLPASLASAHLDACGSPSSNQISSRRCQWPLEPKTGIQRQAKAGHLSLPHTQQALRHPQLAFQKDLPTVRRRAFLPPHQWQKCTSGDLGPTWGHYLGIVPQKTTP